MSDTAPPRNPFAVAFEALPETLPIFPLAGVLLLPGGRLPLNVFEPRYLAMVDHALRGARMIGMIQPARPGGYAGDGLGDGIAPPPVHAVGCAGRIVAFSETGDGRLLITLAGVCRFAIGAELPLAAGGFRVVRADYSRYRADMAAEGLELDRPRLMAALKRFVAASAISTDWQALERIDDRALVSNVSMAAPLDPADKQALLEAQDATRRGRLLIGLLEAAAMAADAAASRERH